MLIKHIKHHNPITSFTKEDYICNESLLEKGSVCGEVYSLNTRYFLEPNMLDPNSIDGVFSLDDSISNDTGKLIAKFKELSNIDTEYPIELLDTTLTDIVNIYLRLVFEENANIDSVLMDFEELVSYLNGKPNTEEALGRLCYILTNFFEVNNNKIETIKAAMRKTTVKQEDGLYLVQIPFLITIPMSFLRGEFKLKNIMQNIKDRETKIDKSSLIYSFLSDLESASEMFKKCGYIYVCYYSNTSFSGYDEFVAYKTKNNEYVIRF